MKLKCTYEVVNWCVGGANQIGKYTCTVKDTEITEPTEIEGFIGQHCNGKTNDDVVGLWFSNQKVEYFPKGLSKIFPNLTAMEIQDCGLKQINKEDLVGFGKLEGLYFTGNKITMLEEDLLMNNPKLQRLSFGRNLIEKVPSKFLESVNGSLEYANFRGNKGINSFFDKNDNQSLGTLMMKVFEQSKEIADLSQKAEDQSKMFGGIFTSGQFSDLAIKVHGKEQKVHKCILAPQSSVFSELFTSDNEAKVHEMKKVSDFGEEIFEEFLRFFYERSLQSDEHVKELFQLAVDFDVPKLKTTCEAAILKSLDEENALQVFNFGVTHSEKLKRAAFDMLKKIHPEIGEYLYEEPEGVNIIVKAKLRYADKE